MEKLERTRKHKTDTINKQNKTKVPSLCATISTSFQQYTRIRRI